MAQSLIRGYRLSPQQKRLWLRQQELAAQFQVQYAILLEGDIQSDVMSAALAEAIERRDALRTTFNLMPDKNHPVQVIRELATVSLLEIYSSQSALEQNIESALRSHRSMPFDLEQGPVVRFVLHRISDDRHVLVMTASSLCADEGSLHTIAVDVARCYVACLSGEEIGRETPPYVRFSEWQNDLLEGDGESEGRRFWLDLGLHTAPPLVLPFEVARPGPFEPACIPMYIAHELGERIRLAAEGCGLALDIYLLACWQALLWILCGQEEILVNTLCDGRIYDEMEDGVGLYAKWLPVRCRFAEDTTFLEAAKAIDEYVSRASAWQEYFSPDYCLPQGHPLTAGNDQHVIAYAFEQWPSPRLVGLLRVSALGRFVWTEPFKLKLVCLWADEWRLLEFHYDTVAYPAEAALQISNQFVQLVEEVLRKPEAPTRHLDISGKPNARSGPNPFHGS